MNIAEVGRESRIARRIPPLLIFLACSLLLFEPAFFAFSDGGKWFQVATFIGLPLLFSALAVFVRWRRLMEYWPAFSSYVVVSIAFLLMWLLDDLPGRWLGLDPKGPPGRAVTKVSDAFILLLVVAVLGKLLRIDFDSVYLRKGRLRLGLAVGLAGFAGMAVFALVEAHTMGISSRRLLNWTPWILTFVFANGLFEELMFRALFLRKFEPLLGAPLANVLTGFVFAVGHAGVTYTEDLLVFVALTFVFALVWGYLMQKTGALWGSALFHAGADTLLIIGILSGIKT
jgi:membrane protease YdiL (CAAX protease family)